jgi:hypothetical protein
MLSQQNKNEVIDRYVDEGQEDTMLPGGVSSSSSSPTGGAVVGRGGRPSPEMLRGSDALPTRESDSGAPPRRESISFAAADSMSSTPATLPLSVKVTPFSGEDGGGGDVSTWGEAWRGREGRRAPGRMVSGSRCEACWRAQ